ncbi:MAG: exodeoxyribonuclease VII large subunit [Desulfobulbaceae bacterium]|nr:exodeoxyribonuclease VII large subunit [Desulfobulbaceae bacterium]
MQNHYGHRIQSVTELTSSIKGLLETSFPFVTVVGEISNVRRPFSGHIYFTMKDHVSQIRAVLFKPQQRYLACTPEDGLEVICRGRISVYEPRGEYQFIVDTVDFKGTGALQITFEKLKKRLAEEGLFDEASKKPLPFLPEKIALITSPGSAAIFDFLTMAENRFSSVPVEIHPVRVQGDGAADEIVDAIECANDRKTSDVIVICRGGGSIEDLWSFNEEKVARAISHSTIPVVSAVGHEVDFTIADFVADLRAPTPTAAAEAVLPSRQTLSRQLNETTIRLATAIKNKLIQARSQTKTARRMLGDPTRLLAHYYQVLDHCQSAMVQSFTNRLLNRRLLVTQLTGRLIEHTPGHRIVKNRQHLDELINTLKTSTQMHLERKQAKLHTSASLLEAVNPRAILKRGYSIVRTGEKGEIVTSSEQVGKGDGLNILLHKGKIAATVNRCED